MEPHGYMLVIKKEIGVYTMNKEEKTIYTMDLHEGDNHDTPTEPTLEPQIWGGKSVTYSDYKKQNEKASS